MYEDNPYRKELIEYRRVQKVDQVAAVKLMVNLRARIEADIEEERLIKHAAFTNELVHADGPRTLELFKELIVTWFDVPARRYLFRFEDAEDTKPYFDVLDYLVKRDEVIWETFAVGAGGRDIVEIILNGRSSYWRAEATSMARAVADQKSSPKALIVAFMERKGIPSFDGRGGFCERFPVIGRDTLFAVRDESRWVAPKTYTELAHIIGCTPEQLQPRIPRRSRKR